MPFSCYICRAIASKENVSMFCVPDNEFRRRRWTEACGFEFSKSAHVCHKHFDPEDFINGPPGNKKCRLMPGAVPKRLLARFSKSVSSSNSCDYANTSGMAQPLADLQNLPIQFNRCNVSANTSYQNLFVIQELPRAPVANASELPVTHAEFGTQTDLQCSEIINLKKHIKKLEAELNEAKKKLADKTQETVVLEESLKHIFTRGQIQRLKYPNIYKNWSWEDISSAICLHAAGPRAYNHLYASYFPIPHVTTLQRWARKVRFEEGVLHFSIASMKNATELSKNDKICVISFDEMKVASTYEYVSSSGMVRPPRDYVQVAIVRGLTSSWKQPIFYDFDCKMTKAILHQLIMQLYNAGYPVVAIVSDMGSTNQALWNELDISIDKTWFENPANSEEKIFVFADVPHLIKLIRNHFLDSGLNVFDSIITPQTLKQVLQHTSSSDVTIVHKLSEAHLTVKNAERQKVKFATQLFSHTSYSAVLRCYELGKEIYNPVPTANFLKLVNDWFDIFNSKLNSSYNIATKMPYGKELSKQDEVLEKMNKVMSAPIIPNRKTLAPFQKGILISNISLKLLYRYIQDMYGVDYILTNRLTQDIAEHFFSTMRANGGMNDHPTPNNFTFRLRKYLLARNTELLKGTGNVEPDQTNWLNISNKHLFNSNEKETPEKEKDSANAHLINEEDEDEEDNANEKYFEDFSFAETDSINGLLEDGLEYVAGYIIHKLKMFDEISNGHNWTWVDQVSQGGLKKPSESFLLKIKQLEVIFNRVNGEKINHCVNLKNVLIEKSKHIEVSNSVKELFFKCRIFFRIKNLNKKHQAEKLKRKPENRKLVKTVC